MGKNPFMGGNQALTKILFRLLAGGYLLYLAWQLAFEGGDDPSFPVALRVGAAVLFAAVAVFIFFNSWKRFRADSKAAEEMAEEPEDDGTEEGEDP